ncbi:MAG: hypothetical protein KC589_10820, partial [Nanoarchaeota archaeon]|nr:hypothetical protein [Nanoarchaeota archaeon]
DNYTNKIIDCSEIINTYPISYYYVESGNILNCNFSDKYNISNKSYIVRFEKYNLTSNLTIDNDKKFKVEIPKIEGKETILIIDDKGNSVYLIGGGYPTYILSFEKFLDTKKEIESKKLTYFFGSWVVVFLLIQFIISFDSWWNGEVKKRK